MTIDRHVFDLGAVGDAAMFRLPNLRRAGWPYVTDEYVEIVLASKRARRSRRWRSLAAGAVTRGSVRSCSAIRQILSGR
jgi:hypothetical protein